MLSRAIYTTVANVDTISIQYLKRSKRMLKITLLNDPSLEAIYYLCSEAFENTSSELHKYALANDKTNILKRIGWIFGIEGGGSLSSTHPTNKLSYWHHHKGGNAPMMYTYQIDTNNAYASINKSTFKGDSLYKLFMKAFNIIYENKN